MIIEGPDGRPAAFHDFPSSAFPFTITAYAPDGGVIRQQTVESGPAVLDIPGGGPGSCARVVMEFADGQVVSSDD